MLGLGTLINEMAALNGKKVRLELDHCKPLITTRAIFSMMASAISSRLSGLPPYLSRPLEKITPELWINLFPQTLGSALVVTWAHGSGATSGQNQSVQKDWKTAYLEHMKNFFPLFGPGLLTVNSLAGSPWTMHFGT